MADRDPAALRSRVSAGETHRRDELVTYLRPAFIWESRFVGMQAQRAMPHVGVPRSDHAPLTVAFGDRHPRIELLARLVKETREFGGITAAQKTLARDAQRLSRARHQALR